MGSRKCRWWRTRIFIARCSAAGTRARVIETSPRRYEEIGPYRTTAMYVLILALYVAPVPVPLLARIHSRFVSGRRCNREFHPLYEHSCQA